MLTVLSFRHDTNMVLILDSDEVTRSFTRSLKMVQKFNTQWGVRESPSISCLTPKPTERISIESDFEDQH